MIPRAAMQVTTTLNERAAAERLADELVRRRLAACVQISGPVRSVYPWQGAVETADEWVCTIKTLPAALESLEATLRALHPYDEPEIIAVEIAASAGYLSWMQDWLADPPKS